MLQLVACCTVSAKPDFQRSFNDTQCASSHQTNNTVKTKPHREDLAHATEAASILYIHSVTVADTGQYSCNVTSTDMTQTENTQVIVHGKLLPGAVHICCIAFLVVAARRDCITLL